MPTIIAPYIGAPIFPAIKIDVGPSAPPIIAILEATFDLTLKGLLHL